MTKKELIAERDILKAVVLELEKRIFELEKRLAFSRSALYLAATEALELQEPV